MNYQNTQAKQLEVMSVEDELKATEMKIKLLINELEILYNKSGDTRIAELCATFKKGFSNVFED